jgi:hypothetical protein
VYLSVYLHFIYSYFKIFKIHQSNLFRNFILHQISWFLSSLSYLVFSFLRYRKKLTYFYSSDEAISNTELPQDLQFMNLRMCFESELAEPSSENTPTGLRERLIKTSCTFVGTQKILCSENDVRCTHGQITQILWHVHPFLGNTRNTCTQQ